MTWLVLLSIVPHTETLNNADFHVLLNFNLSPEAKREKIQTNLAIFADGGNRTLAAYTASITWYTK